MCSSYFQLSFGLVPPFADTPIRLDELVEFLIVDTNFSTNPEFPELSGPYELLDLLAGELEQCAYVFAPQQPALCLFVQLLPPMK
jgi:hypothetical protein